MYFLPDLRLNRLITNFREGTIERLGKDEREHLSLDEDGAFGIRPWREKDLLALF